MSGAHDPVRFLYVVRHAKSSWADPTLDDEDRPLSPRGRRATGLLARWFLEHGIAPALVLCSPSRRTVETATAFMPVFGDDVELRIDDRLYGGGVDALTAAVRETPELVTSLMTVGHNPDAQDLVCSIAERDGAAMERVRTKFPTGAVAVLGVDVPWAELGPGEARLVDYVVPRDLE